MGGKSLIGELDLSNCVKLEWLYCYSNNLTSLDWVNTIPNPEKLTIFSCYNNNIQPTDIAIFSKFVNLKELKIGTMERELGKKHNKFYGSLKAYQNLTKLTSICIEATDVNEGLEYLPFSLGGKQVYSDFECSPHGTNAKCKAIQDQLKPYNYDLLAWQLDNFEKVFAAQPAITTNADLKAKWLALISQKLADSKTEKENLKSDTSQDKSKRIDRIKEKISQLKKAKSKIEGLTEEEFSSSANSTPNPSRASSPKPPKE